MAKYAIEMYDITKMYGNFTANNNISLLVKKGEIHGIVGENGAGKSTLMSILFGLVEPTTGYIVINGREKRIKNALDAERLGIGMVHQHFKLIDIYNAVQNIILGREPRNIFRIIDYKKANKQIEELIEKYKFDINLKVPIDQLTIGQQQKIEILKLLYRNSDILIFDEPTGVLTPKEIESFLKLLEHFKSMGKTIILISHKLNEIKQVCDRATIIKKGQVIDVVNINNTSIDQLSSLMVGRNVIKVTNKRSKNKNTNDVVLNVSHLNRDPTKSSMKLEDVSFAIKAGEILAIAGVEGNGQTELINIITGLEKYSFKNPKNQRSSIKLGENELLETSIKKRYELGLSHIPEDRQKHGLILNSELKNSMFLQEYDVPPFAKRGFISNEAVQKWTHKLIIKYDVRGSNDGETFAGALSGGNQQKAIIAREITRENKAIIIAQPTRGLDVGAIANVHKEILKHRDNNKAILLISYELDEIFALADRILVISSGKISKELDPIKTTYKEIGLLMAGVKGKSTAISITNKNTVASSKIIKHKSIINKLSLKTKTNEKNSKINNHYVIQKSSKHNGWELKKIHGKKATFIAVTKKEVEQYYAINFKNANNTINVKKAKTMKINKHKKINKKTKGVK